MTNNLSGKICAIISGGERSPFTDIEQADFIIACDRGIEYAMSAGIRPDLIIGDFDSYSGALPEGVPVMRLKVEKDDTDTMSAARYAVGHGFSRVEIYSALGGRLDHLFANIQTMAFAVKGGADAHIIGNTEELFAFTGKAVTFPKSPDCSLSVFALDGKCDNVSIRGAKYCLDNAVIESSFPIGTSNQWVGDEIEVSVGSGVILVMRCRMPSSNQP